MRKSSMVLIGFMILISGSALVQERTGPVVLREEAGMVSSEENDFYPSNAIATTGIQADIVEISVSVESTNENGTMASAENKAKMDKIVDALIAIGINKSDISPGQFTGISTGQSSNVVCNNVGNDTICRTESSHKNVLTSTKIVRIRALDPSSVNRILDIVKSLGASASVSSYRP